LRIRFDLPLKLSKPILGSFTALELGTFGGFTLGHHAESGKAPPV
jgi:hypothetical protein